ncbi:glycoside hydrolase family 140 protein [Paenibacillus lycopersici]|uniref:glycoside hydrolase family 140 protein n=1 Tax=Paenibacillus lycopersici TaxID=2704462 RepID=UPI001CDCA1EC|nr:glycoside hydrolase family 140 protein [Paenibacillus lycopersici]
MSLLKISDNKRFLTLEDGSPFFWLGDTAWELFHKLNREESDLYLRNRAERKFNVVQAVALAELDGVMSPNAYGRLPLLKNAQGVYDPSLPDTNGADNYWTHVDYIVDRAAELGIYIALLPTWGDKYNVVWGKGPDIFTQENAQAFGRWLGERYRDRPNIVWVLGGDRPLQTARHFEIIRAMAAGLSEGDRGSHLITFHPPGDCSSSTPLHDEPWLAFNMIQSGHHDTIRKNYEEVAADYGKLPTKPTLDAEPCYEDHPINFNAENGYFDEKDVRIGAYYGVFSGAFGHTYGHHSIWSMTTEPGPYFIMHWQDAIVRPGAAQMQHLRALIESYPFLERVPDQSLIADQFAAANYMVATRGQRYALVYSPNGIPFRVALGKIDGERVAAFWYDPRSGERAAAGEWANHGVQRVVPPSSGRDGDWVLILESR